MLTLHQSVSQNLSDTWWTTFEIGVVQLHSVTEIAPKSPLLGSFSNGNGDGDGDGNENAKKAMGLLSKTTILYVNHASPRVLSDFMLFFFDRYFWNNDLVFCISDLLLVLRKMQERAISHLGVSYFILQWSYHVMIALAKTTEHVTLTLITTPVNVYQVLWGNSVKVP